MREKNGLKKWICMLPVLFFAAFVILALYEMSRLRQGKMVSPKQDDSENYSVSFSLPSGFYEEDFLLRLSAPEGFTIYYTLDGSIPDASSDVYTDALMVTNVSGQPKKYSNRTDFNPWEQQVNTDGEEKAYIIRAVGIDSSGVATDIATGTYFVGYGDAYENTGVLSIVSAPENLFDKQRGIYVLGEEYENYVAEGGDPESDIFANYYKIGRDWERPAHIDYFNGEKEFVLSQEVGLRINGNSSRSAPEKSLRLYARKKYDGNSRLQFSFFEENCYPKSLILRRGGYRNQFLPMLVDDRNIATQSYSTCAVFLDGEFWGNYYILERYDSAYIENNYHVDDDNVTIIKDGALFSGSAVVSSEYEQLLDDIKTKDLSVSENYEYVCTKMDIQSYIDYYCTQIYLNNFDFSENKNNVLWRSNYADEANPYADCRWRWALMDLDFTLTQTGGVEDYQTNSFSDVRAVACHTEEIMFGNLMKNDDFRQQFVNTFLDMENVNFDYERVCEKMEPVSSLIENKDVWQEFFKKRPEYINAYLKESFGLEGKLTEVTLGINDVSGGVILLNTVTPDLSEGSWRGMYYTDYEVTVTAVPEEGYQFVKWIIDGEEYFDSTCNVALKEGGVQMNAVFSQE